MEPRVGHDEDAATPLVTCGGQADVAGRRGHNESSHRWASTSAAEVDQARLGWRPADRPARLRLVADASGLDRHGRAALLPAIDDAMNLFRAAVISSVTRAEPRRGGRRHARGSP